MYRLLTLLFFVVTILVIADILRTNKTSEQKIIWIVAVVLLPILGPVLWFYMGRK